MNTTKIKENGGTDHPECPEGYVLVGYMNLAEIEFSMWNTKFVGRSLHGEGGRKAPLFVPKDEWDKSRSSSQGLIPREKPKIVEFKIGGGTPLNWINETDGDSIFAEIYKPLRLLDTTRTVTLGEDFPVGKPQQMLRVRCLDTNKIHLILKNRWNEGKVVGLSEETWKKLDETGWVRICTETPLTAA